MKKTILFLIAAVLMSFTVSNSYSQDESMQKWMEYMTPGDMQKMLAKGTGEWISKSKFWMAPGGETMESEGESTGEMIMGGRYLMSKHSGNMMGMPFEGMSIEGYDNSLKLFMNTWIDNMGTGIMYLTGTWDESSKSITYTGKMSDPISGGWVDVKEVVTYKEDGSTSMEMYGQGPDGKEFKTMELVFTKK